MPVTVTMSIAVDRSVPAPQAERLGNAQARAVEQRQDRSVAGQDPRLLASRPARVSRSVTAMAAAAESGRGRFFSTLGCGSPRRPRRCRDPPARDAGRRSARPRAAASASGSAPPSCAGRPGTTRMSSGFKDRIAATLGGSPQMLGQKGQELAQVARIGLDGLGRKRRSLASAVSHCRSPGGCPARRAGRDRGAFGIAT